MVSTRAAPSSRPGSTNFAPTTQRQPSRRPLAFPPSASPTAERQRYSASTRPQGKRTPPPAPWTHQTPALPPSAGPPVVRQPNRQTPALQRKHTTTRQANPTPSPVDTPNASPPAVRQPSRHPPALPSSASPTVKRQRYSASERPQGRRDQLRDRGFGSGRLFLAARPDQPGWRDSLVISALSRSIPWKMAIKNRGFCPPFGHFPAHPFNPNAERHFLFYSTSDTPGN